MLNQDIFRSKINKLLMLFCSDNKNQNLGHYN
uniref:Uncharacterized protein n=1 Tax=Arundo donax TaxID=35708 RepID=A0A0A8YMN8_ARUDO